jgi:hypothetical protein
MKIVITGVGALATVGIGARSVFDGMFQEGVEANGEIDGFDPTVFLGKKGIRHFDRTALLLASAARLALDQSRFASADYAPDEIGIVVGSTHGSIQAICEFDQESVRDGPDYVNPQDFANTVINAPASRVAMLYQATGLNTTISTGTASSLDALAYSISMMRLSRAKAILCGAAPGWPKAVPCSCWRTRPAPEREEPLPWPRPLPWGRLSPPASADRSRRCGRLFWELSSTPATFPACSLPLLEARRGTTTRGKRFASCWDRFR